MWGEGLRVRGEGLRVRVRGLGWLIRLGLGVRNEGLWALRCRDQDVGLSKGVRSEE